MIVCTRSEIGLALGIMLLFGGVGTAADANEVQAGPAPITRGDARSIPELAATRALDRLGQPGGFYLDQRYHIPLPSELDAAVSVLKANYSLALADALERSINRVAENTIAIGREKILKAVAGQHPPVVHGEKSVSPATDAVRAKLEPQLVTALRPELGISLDLAATRVAADTVAQRYETVARAPFPAVDYQRYIGAELVRRYFDAMADEESAIRLASGPRSASTGVSSIR